MVKNPLATAGDVDSIPGREDLTCRRAAQPVHDCCFAWLRSPGATAIEPRCHSCWGWNALELTQQEEAKAKRSPQTAIREEPPLVIIRENPA